MSQVKHYYLSEMAVSDRHGGGLTLQRILQKDLQQFDRFIHVPEFLEGNAPITPRLVERQLNLRELCHAPHWRAQFDEAMGRLRLRMFHRWSRDRWIRKAADYVSNNFETKESVWLVVPQRTFSVRVMNHIYRRQPVRYVTWMMDDHVLAWNDGWHYPKRFEPEFRFHLEHAEKVFVISPAMKDFYVRQFGVDSEVLFGPADSDQPPILNRPATGGPVKLVYFGSIWNWQRDALARLVKNLEHLNATLDLFVFHPPSTDLESPRVFVRAPVQGHEVIARTREYDGVVIPASFGDQQRHLTELNIATKLSECYASGTVTVIVSPVYGAMAQFAQTHGGALVISDFNDPTQVEALRQLKDPGRRKQLLDRARRVALSECSSEVMRQRWSRVWSALALTSAGTNTPASDSPPQGIKKIR